VSAEKATAGNTSAFTGYWQGNNLRMLQRITYRFVHLATHIDDKCFIRS